MEAPESSIKVMYRKLGRNKAVGMAHQRNNVIFIDSRAQGFDLLDVLIHETLHCIMPFLTEEAVLSSATEIAAVLAGQLDFNKKDKPKTL
jgi:hypothetical protein